MEDKELILEAYQLISELNKAYQTCKQGIDLMIYACSKILTSYSNNLKRQRN